MRDGDRTTISKGTPGARWRSVAPNWTTTASKQLGATSRLTDASLLAALTTFPHAITNQAPQCGQDGRNGGTPSCRSSHPSDHAELRSFADPTWDTPCVVIRWLPR